MSEANLRVQYAQCSPAFTRRSFLHASALALASAGGRLVTGADDVPAGAKSARDRVKGLLLGTYLGDALGGPIEFQDPVKVQALPDPPKRWSDNERMDDAAIAATAARLRLRSYRDLRPVPEPYAHWSHNAEPGTITDDSRHKLVLLDALRQAHQRRAWPIAERELAQAYLDWSQPARLAKWKGYSALCDEWLLEYKLAVRWVLGERELAQARPTERLWNGLPTCCGQMTSLPLAAIYPGEPTSAYVAAYSVTFADNGWGRDMNAALVAGLATALAADVQQKPAEACWNDIFRTMREIDPLGYRQVPWTRRSVDRWLDLALQAVAQSDRRPARLFARLDREFADTIKWEAQVPFVVVFASLAMCDYDPLAALQLSVEWGHDTDSYAQLLGAFIGVLYGTTIFPREMAATVVERLKLDYGADLDAQVDLLLELQALALNQQLFRLGAPGQADSRP